MPKRRISLGLVIHNEEQNIIDFLEQLRLFVEKSFCEVVIVDNASTDSTVRLITEWTLKDSSFPLRLISSEINHMAYARNRVLQVAVGEWVYFIDADCRLIKFSEIEIFNSLDSLESISRIAAIGGGNIVASDSYWLDRRLHEMSRIWFGHMGSIQLRPPQMIKPVALLSTCNLLVQRRIAIECGGFDLKYQFVGEDMSLSHRLAGKGFVLLSVPGMNVLHLQRMSLFSWAKKMLSYGEAQVRIALRYPAHFRGVRGMQFLAVLGALLLLIFQPVIFLSGLMAYLILLLAASFYELKDFSRSLAATAFICLSHAFYAAGEFWAAVTCFRFLYSTSLPKEILNLEQQ